MPDGTSSEPSVDHRRSARAHLAPATNRRKEVPVTQLAYREATTTPVKEIAAELQDQLGQKLVAYAVGISSPKLVGRWAKGDHNPSDETAIKLRMLYRVVR